MRFFLMSQGSFNPKIRFLGQKVCSVARTQTDRKVKLVLKIPFFKISKNKKMRFFLMSQGPFSPKIRFLGQKVSSVALRQTENTKNYPKMSFFKISKNKKMRFFLMSQGSFNPKIRFLGQKVCPVAAARHTDRQTDTKVTTEGTLSGFQEFSLHLIIKDRPNMND